jgi:4-alpha-glucanotransferase
MRRSGILMHITSLPSPYGIGTMGQEAFRFIDFLESAGQSVWQILPVCPTSFGDSPYQSFSTFAGNPYLIDLDQLAEDGLLRPDRVRRELWDGDPARVDYGALYRRRYPVLREAAGRLLELHVPEYGEFCARSRDWLADYALFMAIKDAQGGRAWQDWPEPLRHRDGGALALFRSERAGDIEFWQALQFLFFRQWEVLKARANRKGISIVGDLPIYVAGDSADVWAHPENFQLDENLQPTEVAGCPPDGFSAAGQLWGNPLFDWDAMERTGFSWWRSRVSYLKSIYDVLRIDHFRGLAAYYAIPAGSPTAAGGRWRRGPGMKLLNAVRESCGLDHLIAEDLGFLDADVAALLRASGLPGMKVLEFAFDSRESGDYLPHNYERNCVVYTGTHDNDTALGWMSSAPSADVETAVEYLRLTEEEGLNWGMMRGAWSSVGELAVVQMQDVLGLGSAARMNTPSTLGGNWQWRMLPGAATADLAAKLRRQMELYQRLPAPRS